MILYFSGTGNSRYCAEYLSDVLDDTILDLFASIREQKALELSSEKPWIFVSPVYGWRMPRFLMNYLQQCRFSGNAMAYFVLDCGESIGNAAHYNKKLCKEKQLQYCGTAKIRMPENYIALYDIPSKEEAQRIVDRALSPLRNTANSIQGALPLSDPPASLLDTMRSSVLNFLFYRFLVRAKAFHVSERCIHCGLCEKSCVRHTIRLQNGSPVWGDHCTHCMACINHCPVRAIEYGKNSRKKTLYHAPLYQRSISSIKTHDK